MARKLSRRDLSEYVAGQLISKSPEKDLPVKLAAYLIESRRTKELDLILLDVKQQLAEKGHVSGIVTSASKLSYETLKAIEDFAREQTEAKEVQLENEIDESVLGGIKLSLPGKELDATISRQLITLKTRYKKA